MEHLSSLMDSFSRAGCKNNVGLTSASMRSCTSRYYMPRIRTRTGASAVITTRYCIPGSSAENR